MNLLVYATKGNDIKWNSGCSSANLNIEDDHGGLVGPSVITRVLKCGGGRPKRSEQCSVRTCPDIAGFADGRRATSQGMWVASRSWTKLGVGEEGGKAAVRKWAFPLGLQKGRQPSGHLDFSLVNQCWTSTYRTARC